MSKVSDVPKTFRKVVVVFDICSSTAILDDLIHNEIHHKWRNLLIGLKEALVEGTKRLDFEIYKFLGDGWILLFDEAVRGAPLMAFLKDLCRSFKRMYRETILPVLSTKVSVIGLTFGIDRGTLMQLVMTGRREYIGRPLNAACRLQGAIRQKDKSPNGKVLISNAAHEELGLAQHNLFRGNAVSRKLRNLLGGEHYRARKIILQG